MAVHEDFEPGFDPVVSLRHEERSLARVGRSRGRLRIEREGDVAFTFDGEGRLISAHVGGTGYRRTLDNRLLVTRHTGRGVQRRSSRDAEPVEPLTLLAQWHAEPSRLQDALARGASVEPLRGSFRSDDPWLREGLARAGGWTAERLATDTERLRDIYLPIPILPPDQYAALVLQATEGCSFNRCSFCSFYRSIPYRERSVAAFDAHLQAVLQHLGRSIENYHRVFLGQANALLVDTDTLAAMLERIQSRLPLRPARLEPEARRRWRSEHDAWIDGVYAFVDSFHEPKNVPDLQRLADLGLRRVYLGLETGSQDLLRLLGKPGSVDDAIALARNLHEARLELGVIVLVGAGGLRHEEEHLRRTVAAIQAMDLRRGDQVYLSKLVIYEGSAYQRRVRQSGLAPLTTFDLASQAETFRQRIREQVGEGVPVAPYDVDVSRSLFTRT